MLPSYPPSHSSGFSFLLIPIVCPSRPFTAFLLEKAMRNSITCFADVPANIPSFPLTTEPPPCYKILGQVGSALVNHPTTMCCVMALGVTGSTASLALRPGWQAPAVPQIFISSCLNNNSLKEKKPFKYFSGDATQKSEVQAWLAQPPFCIRK